MTARIGYARVSTREQNPDSQLDPLAAAGCVRVFLDVASGALAARPQFTAALDYARPGDQLVITKLDRLGRSVRHLTELAADLAGRQVDLVVLDQGIDTSTPGGRVVFHVLAAIAEFERDLISERTRDGLAAARARGRQGGRPRGLTPSQVQVARQLYDGRQHTVQQIATILGVSRATIYRHLDQHTAADGAIGASGEGRP